MKKLLSIAMIVATIGTATYAPKSQAGLVVMASSGVVLGLTWNGQASVITATVGAGIAVAGGVSSFFVPQVGIALLVLSEDGSLAQDQLELALTQKYNFLSDRETTAALASAIITEADSAQADSEGRKVLHLSPSKVAEVLKHSDLRPEEITLISNDLK